MVQDDKSSEAEQHLWLVKSKNNGKERLDSKDLTQLWEKAPKGAMLYIGKKLVAVKH